jgi:hypothetical protein
MALEMTPNELQLSLPDDTPGAVRQAQAVAAGQAVLGGWLLISAFVWPHHGAELYSALISGSLALLCGVWLLRFPALQYASTALGAWLIFSALGLAHRPLTAWHDGLVGAAILALSSIPIPGQGTGLEHGSRHTRPADGPGSLVRIRTVSAATPDELMDFPPALEPPPRPV